MENKVIIAVDFDGTVVTHEFPNIGRDVPKAEEVLKHFVEKGALLILNTMRSDEHLENALIWFEKKGIPLWGINENPDQKSWTNSPKAYAHYYIDDAAIGCPLIYTKEDKRPFVNWDIVKEHVKFDGHITVIHCPACGYEGYLPAKQFCPQCEGKLED